MPNRSCRRNGQGACGRNLRNNPAVIQGRINCCSENHESLAAELYDVDEDQITALECCDSQCGCRRYNAERRCEYWPGFAHPRWLDCRALYNKRCT